MGQLIHRICFFDFELSHILNKRVEKIRRKRHFFKIKKLLKKQIQ